MNKYLRLIRFHAPIGTLLIYFPCVFGVLFGFFIVKSSIQVIILLKFLLGSFLARSAGCVLNDIFDRKFDSQVKRTKNRPLSTGEISIRQALITLFILVACAFAILFALPSKSALICLVAAFFVIFYPLCKRFTHFPQVILGFLFNSGMLAGFFAVSSVFNYSLILPYTAFILWTIIYDTLYAMQDIEDDKIIGIKSTAVKFGANYKIILQFLNILYLILILMFWHINSLRNPIFIFAAFILNAAFIKYSKPLNFSLMFKLSIFPCIILCIGVFVNSF